MNKNILIDVFYMRKKLIIGIGIPLVIILLFWLICILLFPVAIINGISYNKKKLEKIKKERILSYQDLQIITSKDINDLFSKQIEYLFLDTITNIDKYELHNPIHKIASVNSPEGLRIRNKPDINAGKIGLLPDKTLVEVIKKDSKIVKIDGINGKWTYVRCDNIFGWVFDGYLLETNEIAKSIINEYYNKIRKIDLSYFDSIYNYKINKTFPLQYKKHYSLNDIFPPIIDLINDNDNFYDKNALNILGNNIDLLKDEFAKISNNIINQSIDNNYKYYKNIDKNIFNNVDNVFYSDYLSKYLIRIGNIADMSIEYFNYLISECICPDIQNLNVNILQQHIKNILPIELDAYLIEGSFYHATSLDKMNEYITYIAKDWERYNKEVISKLIFSKTIELKNKLEYSFDYHKMDLLSIVNTICYAYYRDMISGEYPKYYINQCKISNKSLNIINDIFPPIIDLINDNDNFYDKNALNIFENNINFNNIRLSSVPIVRIDNYYYNKIVIDELNNSMKIISSCLLENIKKIMIDGVNYQTNLYLKNIDDYVNWYFSSITRLDKTITKINGFLSGISNTDEKYFIDNFNRIIYMNTDFYKIINKDMNEQVEIVVNLLEEYLYIIEYFKLNYYQISTNILTKHDYIGVYIDDIIAYFEQVNDTLNDQINFHFQDFTIKDNSIVKNTKTTVKLLSGVNFLSGLLIDYFALKTQKILNSSELKKHINDKMIEGQNNKIAIIKDPFNFSFNELSVGSILFVDNYFVGLNTYQHYGVYIGNKKVIHFAPLEGQEISAKNGVIHETTLDKFLNGRALQIERNIKIKFSEGEIIKRARSRLGEKGYDLFTNNCEHFTRWCVTGDNVSYQINNLPKKIDTTFLTIRENFDRVNKFAEFVGLFF